MRTPSFSGTGVSPVIDASTSMVEATMVGRPLRNRIADDGIKASSAITGETPMPLQLVRLFILLCVLSASAVNCIAAEPIVSVILPRGGQRGTEMQIELHGQRLADALEIVFDRPGIEILELIAENDSKVNAKVRIAADCMLGVHAARLRTSTGISNLRLFSVGALPEVNEAEPNNTLESAQAISFNCTINGIADNEDLDVFALDVTKDQRISVEVEGMRLGDQLFDPSIAILDGKGFEIVRCDDAALLRQDAFASIIAPEAGKYFVHVREASYAGNGGMRYRLHVGSFPRPTLALPLGAKPGETIDATLLGGGMTGTKHALTLPSTLDSSISPGGWWPIGTTGLHVQDSGGISPSPILLRVNQLENIVETEPNNDHANATPATLPAALNGIIDTANDYDCFKFSATQGQRIIFAVFARQLRSPLDAVLRIDRIGSGTIAANDDANGPDPLLDFTAPENGEYVVVIHDHLLKGGDDYGYRVECWVDVSIALAQLPRNFEHIMVPRGGRMANIVTAVRINHGEVQFSFPDLPAGVTANAPSIPVDVGQFPMVFEAAADAPLDAELTRVSANSASQSVPYIASLYQQNIELTLGQNNVIFQAHSVDRIPVVVVEEAPFAIEVVDPKAPLVQSGVMELVVCATRKEGFAGPIRLRVPWVPPGVGANNSIVIQPDQTEARVPMNANGNATARDWPLVVIGECDTDRGTIRTSSQLFNVKVSPPYLAFQPQGTSVEQGKPAQLSINVERTQPFEGNASVRLEGLPHNVTAPPLELPPEGIDLTFAIESKPDSPAGKHTGVFCVATIRVNGEPVVHFLPAGELRIDVPIAPPAPAEAVAPPPPPPPEAPPAERPLTRLERLRKEYEEKKNNDGTNGDG